MRRSGLSQRAIAKKIGVSQTLIGFYAVGRRVPTLASAERIIKALGPVAPVEKSVAP